MLISLNDDPGREETLAVLKDAYRRGPWEDILLAVGVVEAEMRGVSVSWSLSEKGENEATLDYLRISRSPV